MNVLARTLAPLCPEVSGTSECIFHSSKCSMNMFTATKLQAAVYLFGVCLFSVCTFQYSNIKDSFWLITSVFPIHMGPIYRKWVIDLRSLTDRIPSISKLVRLVRHHQYHRTED